MDLVKKEPNEIQWSEKKVSICTRQTCERLGAVVVVVQMRAIETQTLYSNLGLNRFFSSCSRCSMCVSVRAARNTAFHVHTLSATVVAAYVFQSE